MLDIIIPVYNNPEGLQNTLKSINQEIYNDITITIVDDCSSVGYDWPVLRMEKNSGPGAARQYGIDNTFEPFIMFIDAGDVFVDNNVQLELIDTLKSTNGYLYSWHHNTIKKDGTIILEKHTNNRLHGKVYSREFLKKYGIQFCQDPIGSYANEDIAFNILCRAAIVSFSSYEEKYLCYEKPIINWTYDENSITHNNDGEFKFIKHVPGLVANTKFALKIMEEQEYNRIVRAETIFSIFGRLYTDLVFTSIFSPKNAEMVWENCKDYYINCYLPYDDLREQFDIYVGISITRILKEMKEWKNPPKLNFRRFLDELRTEEELPKRYLVVQK